MLGYNLTCFVLQVALPCLKSMTWAMESKNTMPGGRVAVINLKVCTIPRVWFLCSLIFDEMKLYICKNQNAEDLNS